MFIFLRINGELCEWNIFIFIVIIISKFVYWCSKVDDVWDFGFDGVMFFVIC